MQQYQVVYNNDTRYPGPSAHPPPPEVTGLPTQADMDAFPRLFTWGELKAIIQSGDLELLMRNKALQARYDNWMKGIKARYGSTENYLTGVRLPWTRSVPAPAGPASSDPALPAEPTYDQRTALDHPEIDLTPATNPDNHAEPSSGASSLTGRLQAAALGTPGSINAASHLATASTTPGRGAPGAAGGSGASTPSSAGFVSLATMGARLNRALKAHSKRTDELARGSGADQPDGEDDGEGEGEDEAAVYLRVSEGETTLDPEKYAVLPNDWPYCVPYGARHFCVWSRIPIAHPALVNYDPEAWARVEQEGLGGFTGVTPFNRSAPPTPTSPTGPGANGVVTPIDTSNRTPPTPTSPGKSATSIDQPGLWNLSVSPLSPPATPPLTNVLEHQGRGKSVVVDSPSEWYGIDVAHSGSEMRRWAGVNYECRGGHEVGRMVRMLWDERGWECIWFVNPPRLQSIPGFSHFHVFARRKTPEEIDAAESSVGNEVEANYERRVRGDDGERERGEKSDVAGCERVSRRTRVAVDQPVRG